ncbi:MAG TPA: TetR/AcrR family transcriptional regulator [Bacteroidia bacterium]|nr:TetR/AcrR family transcriptional regulator [Bacteroidia bacterium]
MKTKKERPVDRRIQKTKKGLTEALINLILEKGYEKVTVQDIIDKANVGRSTFYIHYESKEQLLLDGHNNLNIKIFSDNPAANGKNKEIDFQNLFAHVGENLQLAKAMIGKRSGSMVTDFFRNNIALKVKKKYRGQFRKNKAEEKWLNYLSDACGAAVISLLISWIDEDMPFSSHEMAEKSTELVNSVFAGLIAG